MKIFQRLLLAIILLLLLLATVALTSCANKWGSCPTYGKAHQTTVRV